MKLLSFISFCILSSSLTPIHGQQVIPFDDPRWVIQAQGSLREPYKGYNSLYLTNGIAYLKGIDFSDGVIEFDMFQSYRTSFSGMIFRVRDLNNYEEIYLRSQQTGYPDAFQYTPVFNNDPAWQLYHDAHDAVNDGFLHWKPRGKLMGYNTVASYAFDRWTHVRLLVRGQQAELYVDDMQQPLTFIRELLMNINSGMLGLKSGAGGVWFSNFTYRPDPQITFQTKPDGYTVSTPAGTISSFEVSDPFRENLFQDVNELRPEQLQRFTWKELKAEKSGLANISRLYPVTDSNTVFVKITVRSAKDMIKRLDLGYSDRIKVYCNNTALFSGQQNFRSRDFRYLGTIGYFESVYLPLKKGDNSILLAVSETFGGWGIMAKWDNMDGLN